MTAQMQVTRRSTTSEILEGTTVSLPVMVGVAPFGALFAMLAIDNGFSVADTLFMSIAIYGGASQMVGVDLFGARVAPWLIVLSIFAVNFRHVLYSATIGRHLAHWSLPRQIIAYFLLVDPQFAEAERRVERGIPLSFAWYMGMAVPIYLSWIIATYIGAIFGRLVPDPHAVGIDFLLPIYFFCLVLTFRSRVNWLPIVLASGAASILAYLIIGSPWHVSIGALAGVALGACLPLKAETVQTDEGVL